MPSEIGIVMQPVQSSNISARGYNEGQRTLAVEFTGGDVWQHFGVPPGTWERWLEASSPGSFYAHHIRGVFPSKKMTGACPDCGDRPGPIGTKCTSCGCGYYGEVRREQA